MCWVWNARIKAEQSTPCVCHVEAELGEEEDGVGVQGRLSGMKEWIDKDELVNFQPCHYVQSIFFPANCVAKR